MARDDAVRPTHRRAHAPVPRRSLRARREPHPRRGEEPRRLVARRTTTTSRLDLTTGPETFRSDDHGAVLAPRARRVDLHRRASPTPCTRSRSTASTLDPAAVSDGVRIQLDGLAAENELTVDADAPLHEHRRGPAPLRRPGRRRGLPLHAVRGARTPAACSPCSSSPTSRRRSSFTVTAPAHWEVVSATPPRPSPTAGVGRRRRRATWAFAPTPRISSLHHGARRRPVRRRCATSSRARRPRRPARRLLPQVADRSTSTPTTSSTSTRKGFAFFEEKFDYPYPFDEVRPALRARVQRGRDGERRRRDLHRDLRLPLQGDRRRSRSAASSRSCTSSRTCGSATSSP